MSRSGLGSVLVMFRWCLGHGHVSIVSPLRYFSVVSWSCFVGVSDMFTLFGGVSRSCFAVSVMFWWCLALLSVVSCSCSAGVPAMFWWCCIVQFICCGSVSVLFWRWLADLLVVASL